MNRAPHLLILNDIPDSFLDLLFLLPFTLQPSPFKTMALFQAVSLILKDLLALFLVF